MTITNIKHGNNVTGRKGEKRLLIKGDLRNASDSVEMMAIQVNILTVKMKDGLAKLVSLSDGPYVLIFDCK